MVNKMAKKYNTQKYSQGRSNNRLKLERTNIIYDLINNENYHISIDSEFEYDHFDNTTFKEVYANIYGEQITMCKIDESVQIDCDFMENIQKIYDECRNSKIYIHTVPIDTSMGKIPNYESSYIKMNTCPSSYHAFESTLVEFEYMEGCFQEISKYEFFTSRDNLIFISGHSTCIGINDNEGIDIELISNMTHFEFYHYFNKVLRDVR
jgi:hypothetical protein